MSRKKNSMNSNLKSLIQHVAYVSDCDPKYVWHRAINHHLDKGEVFPVNIYYPGIEIGKAIHKAYDMPDNIKSSDSTMISNIKSLACHYMAYYNLPKTDIILQGDCVRRIVRNVDAYSHTECMIIFPRPLIKFEYKERWYKL